MKNLLSVLVLIFAAVGSPKGASAGSNDPMGHSGFSTSGLVGGAVAGSEFMIIHSDGTIDRRPSPTSPPPKWKITDTDPEMYALAKRLGVGGGGRDCGTGMWMYRYGFRGDGKRFVKGGSGLARYLTNQYALARHAGTRNAATFLFYAAYTESDAIVAYLAKELDRATVERDTQRLKSLMRAAAVSARSELVDDLLYVLENWRDASNREHVEIRTGSIHALHKLIDYTEVERRDVVSLLRAIEWDPLEARGTREAAWRALNRWENYQIMERRAEYPSEFGERRRYPRKLVEASRRRDASLLQRDPERIGPNGCIREHMHCGLAEWAIGD